MRIEAERLVPMRRIDAAALDRLEPAHRHHRVGRPGRPARRLEAVEPDIGDIDPERRRDRCIVGRRADLLRQARQVERRAAAIRPVGVTLQGTGPILSPSMKSRAAVPPSSRPSNTAVPTVG